MISSRLAKTMFEGYKAHSNGLTYDNKPIPTWEQLGEDVRQHWIAAAEAGRNAMIESMGLEAYELQQIKLSRFYMNNYSDARFYGHNTLSLLAKIATVFNIR